MPDQPPQNAPYGHDGTEPAPTDPQTLTDPQTATQDRNEWAAGYASARRYYGDSAPIALDKIRERIDQYRDEHGHRPPHMFDLDELLYDLTAILDTAKEPKL